MAIDLFVKLVISIDSLKKKLLNNREVELMIIYKKVS